MKKKDILAIIGLSGAGKSIGNQEFRLSKIKKGADMATNKRYYWIKLKEEFFTDKINRGHCP